MKLTVPLIESIVNQIEGTAAVDLACSGTSIRGLGAFSLESLGYLASADVVYYYPPSVPHCDFMRSINPNVIDLNQTIYVKGSAFEPAYDAIVAEVMGALAARRRVAYAVQGSPAFHCGTAVRLHHQAKKAGFSSIIISGISSLELLCAQLTERHYNITNLQIYSAVDIAYGSAAIDSRVPCLLCDLGRYALPRVREAARTFSRERLELLGRRLRATYPPKHPVLVMQVAPSGRYHIEQTDITVLDDVLPRTGAGITMFLPAKPVRPTVRSRQN
jgi:hypothetical protein